MVLNKEKNVKEKWRERGKRGKERTKENPVNKINVL